MTPLTSRRAALALVLSGFFALVLCGRAYCGGGAYGLNAGAYNWGGDDEGDDDDDDSDPITPQQILGALVKTLESKLNADAQNGGTTASAFFARVLDAVPPSKKGFVPFLVFAATRAGGPNSTVDFAAQANLAGKGDATLNSKMASLGRDPNALGNANVSFTDEETGDERTVEAAKLHTTILDSSRTLSDDDLLDQLRSESTGFFKNLSVQ